MGARLRSWWQNNRKPLGYLGLVIVGLLVIVLVIRALVVNGTGFDPTMTVTVSKATTTSPMTVTTIKQYQQGKTLWDWLQLLIIPIVLAIGGFWFNQIQKDRDQKAEEAQKQREEDTAKEREKLERESREDNQREVALQSYIDKMSELLLEKKLRDSKPEEEVRSIARIQTLTVLRRLDGLRKGSVLQFLHESGLIDKGKRIIDLRGAHLDGANLNGADLRAADLRAACLYEAELILADLRGADLRRANLEHADLAGAYLFDTRLAGSITPEQLATAQVDEELWSP